MRKVWVRTSYCVEPFRISSAKIVLVFWRQDVLALIYAPTSQDVFLQEKLVQAVLQGLCRVVFVQKHWLQSTLLSRSLSVSAIVCTLKQTCKNNHVKGNYSDQEISAWRHFCFGLFCLLFSCSVQQAWGEISLGNRCVT